MASRQSNGIMSVKIKEERIDPGYQDGDIKPNFHHVSSKAPNIQIKKDPASEILRRVGLPPYQETEKISTLQPTKSEDTDSGISDIGAVTSSSESLVEGKVGENQLTIPCSVNLVKLQQSSKKIVLKNHDGSGYYNLTREDDSVTWRIEETKVPRTRDLHDVSGYEIYTIIKEEHIGAVCIKEEVHSSETEESKGVQGRERSSFEDSNPERIDASQDECEQDDDDDDDNDDGTDDSHTPSSSEKFQSMKPTSKKKGKLYNCSYCTEQFRTNSEFKIHLKKDTKPYSCKFRSKRFKSTSECQKHEKSFIKCLECHKGFYDPLLYTCHNAVKKCHVCGEEFSLTCLLEKHMKRSHPKERGYDCPMCVKGYIYACTLDAHMVAHLELKCQVCNMIFAQSSLLKDHMKTHDGLFTQEDLLKHRFKIQENDDDGMDDQETLSLSENSRSIKPSFKNKEKSYRCKYCTKQFPTKWELKIHLKKHKKQKRYSCESESHMKKHKCVRAFLCTNCGKSLKSQSSLNKHKMIHTGEKHHKCAVCEKRFLHKCKLVAHIRTHTGEGPFYCTLCNKNFCSKSHMRTHSDERSFGCTHCGKSFKTRGALNAHRKIHTGEKPHKCPVCQRGFLHKGKLIIHMRLHTGERPYPCTECNRRFNEPAQLRSHMRTHTGEKPFQCTECDKKFPSASTQVAHMRTHTGERPYSCTQCDKRFVMKGHLNVHLRIHTGELPYLCPHCGKRFRIKAHLRAHEERIHSLEKE